MSWLPRITVVVNERASFGLLDVEDVVQSAHRHILLWGPLREPQMRRREGTAAVDALETRERLQVGVTGGRVGLEIAHVRLRLLVLASATSDFLDGHRLEQDETEDRSVLVGHRSRPAVDGVLSVRGGHDGDASGRQHIGNPHSEQGVVGALLPRRVFVRSDGSVLAEDCGLRLVHVEDDGLIATLAEHVLQMARESGLAGSLRSADVDLDFFSHDFLPRSLFFTTIVIVMNPSHPETISECQWKRARQALGLLTCS